MTQDNNSTNQETPQDDWKQRTYVTGALIGAAMGLFSAYLFARSAEENEDHRPPQIATGTLISLFLAILSLMRQIAESGKDKKKTDAS